MDLINKKNANKIKEQGYVSIALFSITSNPPQALIALTALENGEPVHTIFNTSPLTAITLFLTDYPHRWATAQVIYALNCDPDPLTHEIAEDTYTIAGPEELQLMTDFIRREYETTNTHP